MQSKDPKASFPTPWLQSERDEAPASLEALHDSEKRYRILSELTNDYCYVAKVHDGRLRAVWLTGAFTRITGFGAEQLGDDSLWGIVHDADRPHVQTALSRVQRGENVVHEFRVVTLTGSTRWLREHMRAEREPTGELTVYGAARDVTERHLAQTEQENLEAQLRQSQKMDAVGRLAGGIAHDFNNLLTVILTHSGFLLSELPPRTQRHDDASDIQAAARRAAELTQRLLAFSRQQVITPTVLDLNTVLRDLEPVLNSLVGAGTELEMRLFAGAVQLRADRAQVEQIVLNFVVNARDAMPDGGKLTVTTARVDLDAEYAASREGVEPGPYVELCVRDTGAGMSESVLARIFEPFFTTKEQGKGTGLGLSTVYGIVKQSRGCLQVESRVGFGSAFQVFFPQVDEPVRREPSARPSAPRRDLEETILVVEDEEGVRRGVQRILKQAKYNVLVAADPAQAIALAEDYGGAIDLLLTDVVMPMMSGAELSRHVLALRPFVRVLFMSGHAREGIDTQQASDGELNFLQKPFTRKGLLEKVADVLSSQLDGD